jgi:L-ascorbate metabolism protein UlaG (beta-lactamase superfamily)
MASFADRLTSPLPRFRDVFRMMRERGPARDLAADAAAIPVAASQGTLPAATGGATAITWVGHATFVVRLGGLTILTDPVWSRKIPGVAPRLTPAGVAWEELPPIDAVVISHNHYDHLDAPTIRRLPRDTPILVPAKLADWFRRRSFTAVTELDWWESHQVGEVRFDFVPSHHWSRRSLTDTCRTLWGGWVLTGPDGARVYFAGDTGYGHWFGEIGARYPGIDLALMPIGAYEPRWFMQSMHVNPDEAVRACEDLDATRMATMHWGTFILSAEPVAQPLERTAKAWAETGRPREHLWDLAVGETRTLPEPEPRA